MKDLFRERGQYFMKIMIPLTGCRFHTNSNKADITFVHSDPFEPPGDLAADRGRVGGAGRLGSRIYPLRHLLHAWLWSFGIFFQTKEIPVGPHGSGDIGWAICRYFAETGAADLQ